MPNKSGFTLIELLIVISIIGILSVIGMIAYTTFLKNARDAKRQSDLKFIQSALEEYHADKFSYPESLNDLTSSGGKIYMSQIPTDPKGANYSYTKSGYCLSASLENLVGKKTEGSCTNPTGYNFTVTRP